VGRYDFFGRPARSALQPLLWLFLAAQPALVQAAGGLSEAPPLHDLPVRVQWADKQADALRSLAASSPHDRLNAVMLASLAVVAASDLERALAIGDLRSAGALRSLIERKLRQTLGDIGWIAGHGAGGGSFALGVLALHGIARPRDRESACRLFSSGWEQGFRQAAFRLSECFAQTDSARSLSLLRAAGEAGHALANEQLGRACLEATPRDTGCAFSRISTAASAGRASAKSLLGWMYSQGIGVTADWARTLALYEEAAGAGDLSARNNLGELHETGRGVRADPVKAAQYYREAAEAGFGPAQFNLGRLYAAGIGVSRDPVRARTWLRSALKSGIRPAQQILDWLDTQPAENR
jgi:uncharacterized protein